MNLAMNIKHHRKVLGSIGIVAAVLGIVVLASSQHAQRVLKAKVAAPDTQTTSNTTATTAADAGSQVTINGQTFDLPQNSSVTATNDGTNSRVTTTGDGKTTTKTVPNTPDTSGNVSLDIKSNNGGQSTTFGSHQTFLQSFSSSQSSSQNNDYVYSNGNVTVQTSH